MVLRAVTNPAHATPLARIPQPLFHYFNTYVCTCPGCINCSRNQSGEDYHLSRAIPLEMQVAKLTRLTTWFGYLCRGPLSAGSLAHLPHRPPFLECCVDPDGGDAPPGVVPQAQHVVLQVVPFPVPPFTREVLTPFGGRGVPAPLANGRTGPR